jgi:hypothetical protein
MRTCSTSGIFTEHRFKERKAVQLDVVIYRNHIPIAVGKTRDIGTGGMGIESDISNLKDYSMLEVEIGVNQPSQRRYYRLNGMVIHRSNKGFGITFTDLTTSNMEWLMRLMKSNEPNYSQPHTRGNNL